MTTAAVRERQPMHYAVIHDTAGRIRINFTLPKFPQIDPLQLTNQFRDIAGVSSVSFSRHTANLLVKHDGLSRTRAAILNQAAAAPVPSPLGVFRESALDHKRKAAVRAGTLLLLTPLIPLPLRPVLAVWGALPTLRKGVSSLAAGKLDGDVLDASAVGGAIATRDFLTCSVIGFLLKLGEFVQEWTRSYSRRVLAEMFFITGEWAWVERDGIEVRVLTAEVLPGDVVVVRTGSLIPVDGVVVDGEAMVNQSNFSGEGEPVLRRKGNALYAGAAIEEGCVRIRAERVGTETRGARLVRMIAEAEAVKPGRKSGSERLAERIVPYSFAASGLTLALTGSLRRAAEVMLVDYACAIKLSTPLVILASLAGAARRRILVKGGLFLETLSLADTIVLDKAGTLTELSPRVARIVALNGFTRETILRNAACVDEDFPHPIATAIVRAAAEEGLLHREKKPEVEYVPAHGLATTVDGERVVVGTRHFVHEDEGISIDTAEEAVAELSAGGYSVVHMGIGGKLAGLIAIDDPLRDGAATFVSRLRDAGLRRVLMVTGDNEATAAAIARNVGIVEVHSQALPEEKVRLVRDLQRSGHVVAMVGGGINDAPALAAADVGISMAPGSELTREAADIVLSEATLEDILRAREISKQALGLIEANFRTFVVILAATSAMPALVSATVHNLSMVLVALRAVGPLLKDKRRLQLRMRDIKDPM